MEKYIGLGVSDFKQMIKEDVYYVDKTMYIKEIIDNRDKVVLVTRPRRFGKTLNMSMLRYYFDNRVKDSKELFNGLEIMTQDERYLKEMNKYPVIYLSLARVKETNFEEMILALKSIVMELYQEHRYLLDSDKLYEEDKNKIKEILNAKEDNETLKTSILDLCTYLERHYGEMPIVLIDEYDVPLQNAYVHGYYEEAINFIRRFYTSAFKDNVHLKKAVLTGVSRIAKESIFSDLNNLSVSTVMENKFTDLFGFTESEVKDILKYFEISENMENVKLWYDGYKIGNLDGIYNPWSILNFASEQELKPYWVNTSSNDLIKMILKDSTTIKEKIERLLKNEEVEVIANFDTVLKDIEKNENNVWGLFISTGYLKVTEKLDHSRKFKVKIPNFEIKELFKSIVDSWFYGKVNGIELSNMLNDLITLNFESYSRKFQKIVMEMFSYFDVGNDTAENFYHAFVLGMLVNLKDSYYIRSNRESGLGRYDIMLEPNDKNENAFIMEFKVYDELDNEKNIMETIQNAKNQIENKKYENDLKSRGYKNIKKVVYAFKGKETKLEMY